MDSRPGETSTTADLSDRIAKLPQELQLEIFNLLNLQMLGRMQQTSRYYNSLLMDNLFWDRKQTIQFLSTPYIDDNKNQYHAALLYHEAMTHSDVTKKQIGALRLRRYLQQQLKPWSSYYRGLSFFNGFGVKRDRTIGFRHLLDALDIEDYRAAIFIAQWLVDAKIDEPELFKQLMPLLNDRRQELMHALILGVHKKKITPVAKLLGSLHAHGIGVEANFAMTEKYYLDVLTNIANVANDMAQLSLLKFDTLASDLDLEKKAVTTIAYLKTFLDRLPDAPVQSVINCWSAYLEFLYGNHNAAIELLENTPEFPHAKIFLADLLADIDLPQLGVLRLIELTGTNEDIAGKLFDLQMQFSTVSDSVRRTRDLTKCSMIELATRVSAIYRREIEMETIACDPYMVWWLQLAAQAGCEESLKALQSVDEKKFPYVSFALAVIYEFGILNSDTIEPNHDKAEYYFNLTEDENLKKYLQSAHDNKFACEEVIALLESKNRAATATERATI